MNTRDSYEKLFKQAVKDQNVEYTDILHKECTEHKFNANELLEEAFKNHVITMINNSNLTTTQHFIEFSIKIAKRSLISAHLPALLISHIFEIMPVDKCKDFFVVLLEDKIETWREDAFLNNAKTILLRLCNNLLARLSTVEQGNLRGRIMIFMSILLPFYDRSGCNVDNQYNTELLTVESESSFDTVNELASDLNFDNFKVLQKYLSDPDKCVTKEHWDMFSQCTTHVLNFFVNNDIKETQSSLPFSQVCGKIQLTNNVLRESVYNYKFRRQILVQVLMTYQYLNSKVLNKEQLEAIKTNTETIYKILTTTPPDGQAFLAGIKRILEREKQWSAWKKDGCPERPKPARTKLNFRKLPQKRQLGDILKEQFTGNKSVSPHTTTSEDCMSQKRNFFPTLTSYLREAAEELTAESTVSEESKKIYDGNFGWKALRLMAKRSNRFYDYIKDPMANKSEYLKIMILRVLDAERDSAELTDDELNDEACASSTIQVPITNAEFEALFGTLGDDWKILATRLGFTDSEIESIEIPNPTPSSRASCILRSWFLGPNNPTIEYFCTVMNSIGHSEITNIIKMKYLAIDTPEPIEKK